MSEDQDKNESQAAGEDGAAEAAEVAETAGDSEAEAGGEAAGESEPEAAPGADGTDGAEAEAQEPASEEPASEEPAPEEPASAEPAEEESAAPEESASGEDADGGAEAGEETAAPEAPEHDYDSLHAMNVAQLREVASTIDHEAVHGFTTMHKEHLVPAICKALGIEAHEHHDVVGIDKEAVKARIRTLKKERDEAEAAGDKARLKLTRRRIRGLKRKIRKATV